MATRNVRFTRGPGTDEIERAYALADALTVRALRSRAPQQGGPVQVAMSPWEGVAQLGEAWIAGKVGQNARRLAEADRERTLAANDALIRQLSGEQAPQYLGEDGKPTGRSVRMPEDMETGRPMLLNDRSQALAAAMAGQDPRAANAALGGAVVERLFRQPVEERVDVGDRILILRDGKQVGELPKGATPDTALREQGADRRHVTPSGSAVLGEQGANYRHSTPSGSAQLGASVSMRGQDIGAANAAAAREQAAMLNDPSRRAQGEQASRDQKQEAGAKSALEIINTAEPLIAQSTGSYLGAGIDQIARAFGSTTDGAIAVGQLKTLQAALMMKLPRMEGPQSNYDVQLYREAAGQIGDPTVPNAQKVAALNTIRDLQEKYAGMQPGESRPTSAQGGTGSWGAPQPRPGDKYLTGGQ